jgi:hypothetical protein
MPNKMLLIMRCTIPAFEKMPGCSERGAILQRDKVVMVMIRSEQKKKAGSTEAAYWWELSQTAVPARGDISLI